MNFQNKIRELDFIHARLEAERLAIEARAQHDRNMQLAMTRVKEEQLT